MKLPYETATAGDRALAQLQGILGEFGCQSFGTMIDVKKGAVIVQFEWRTRQVSLEASWNGYAAAWLKAHPYKSFHARKTKAQYEDAALKQARISVCSVLRDWVKGQVTAIECGAMSFECAFLPHLLTHTGQRLADKIKDTNLLPYHDDKERNLT